VRWRATFLRATKVQRRTSHQFGVRIDGQFNALRPAESTVITGGANLHCPALVASNDLIVRANVCKQHIKPIRQEVTFGRLNEAWPARISRH
jgi:hypothetical protein